MKVSVISLGCHKNLVDSENIIGILVNQKGFEIASTIEEADIVVVNTCGFIGDAKRESIETIIDVAKYKEIGKLQKLIVTGCLAQRYAMELAEELIEVDAFIGTGEIDKVSSIIDSVLEGHQVIKKGSLEFLMNSNTDRILTTFSHVAYVKIAEGCNKKCSYCVIPDLRGKFRSRPIEDIIEEVEKLVKNGVKEINIIAQDSTDYGLDIYNERKLSELLERLCGIENLKWIKVFYTYPSYIDEKMINVIKENEKICKYFDVPIQHINDEILEKMNRHSNSKRIIEKLEQIRSEIPSAVFRTSVIVGFPGESQEQFEELYEFLKKFKFDYVGVFKYSREEDTPAYSMENQIDEEVKEKRWAELENLQRRISEEKNRKYIGEEIEVIVDDISTVSEHMLEGRARFQALEIDGNVLINDGTAKRGEIVLVRIEQNFDYDLLGGIVKNEFTK